MRSRLPYGGSGHRICIIYLSAISFLPNLDLEQKISGPRKSSVSDQIRIHNNDL